jgi:hypothetical protein
VNILARPKEVNLMGGPPFLALEKMIFSGGGGVRRPNIWFGSPPFFAITPSFWGVTEWYWAFVWWSLRALGVFVEQQRHLGRTDLF